MTDIKVKKVQTEYEISLSLKNLFDFKIRITESERKELIHQLERIKYEDKVFTYCL